MSKKFNQFNPFYSSYFIYRIDAPRQVETQQNMLEKGKSTNKLADKTERQKLYDKALSKIALLRANLDPKSQTRADSLQRAYDFTQKEEQEEMEGQVAMAQLLEGRLQRIESSELKINRPSLNPLGPPDLSAQLAQEEAKAMAKLKSL